MASFRIQPCILSAALISLALGACVRAKTQVAFRVTVKTNQGDPVGGADIKIANEKIGKSSDAGTWSETLELSAGEKVRLEVVKSSDVNYYAPDFHDFIIAEGGSQEVKYDATLYFVPKPSAKDPKASTTTAGEKPADGVEANENGASEAPANASTGGSLTGDLNAGVGENSGDDIPADQGTGSPEVTQAPEATIAGDSPAAEKTEPVDMAPSGATNEDLASAVAEKGGERTADDGINAPASILPKMPKILLNTIEGSTELPPLTLASYPKLDSIDRPNYLYTIQVSDGKAPVADVEIYLGREDKGDLKVGCQTNGRGRCVIRFRDLPEAPVKFIARKSGYLTTAQTIRVADKGILRFTLERGETIDIFAVARTYGFSSGIRDVDVYIDGKKAGQTDAYGHMSYVYQGSHNDLLEVTLKSTNYLPEEYQKDFVVAGPMAVTRYFTPKELPPARITFLRAQPAGKAIDKDLRAFNPEMDASLRRAARNHFFAANTFVEYPFANFDGELRDSGVLLTEMLTKGWQNTDLKGKIDALIVPTIVTGDSPTLELTVIDSAGTAIAAAKEDLASLTDKSAIDHAVASLAKKIVKAFPFEGSVLGKKTDTATINIGKNSGRGLEVGDSFEVYGNQATKQGNRTENSKIATLTVLSMGESTSECRISNLAPRAIVERGDQVLLKRRIGRSVAEKTQDEPNIKVSASLPGGKEENIAQANVYFNGEWIGTTAQNGRIYFDTKQVNGTGLLKVIKQGYDVYSKSMSLTTASRIDVNLKRESAHLRIESVPAGATVTVDGVVVGKTPINQSVPVPAGFVKVELSAGGGFRSFSQVMELDQGTLDLTGPRAIKLESNFRDAVARLLEAGKASEALARLEEVPETHSDYLVARHQIGEIYLTQMNDPARAAAAFATVTANPSVRDFNDKRFIGSHIDEGIALFMTGEKLVAEDKTQAAAHYQKAVEILSRVAPFLRFVQKEQYARAVHNTAFHKALAQHRLWQQTSDPAQLQSAIKDWREYLEGSAKDVPAKNDDKAFVENAKIYFQQARASLEADQPKM